MYTNPNSVTPKPRTCSSNSGFCQMTEEKIGSQSSACLLQILPKSTTALGSRAKARLPRVLTVGQPSSEILIKDTINCERKREECDRIEKRN